MEKINEDNFIFARLQASKINNNSKEYQNVELPIFCYI